MKTAFLGPDATFTEMAVKAVFPDTERIACQTIPDCLEAVKNNQADAAVIPLENALEGSVNVSVDYLYHEENPPIRGEIIVPIKQHLMVHPHHAQNWEKAEKIVSHPHALAQCHKFLRSHFQKAVIEPMNSTAAAAKYVSEHPEGNYGAIANQLAAEKYGLTIVKADIQDYTVNHTRFIALSDRPLKFALSSSVVKTSVMVTLASDRAGSLNQVLSAFAWRNLNLSKLESRPLKTGLGNYFFMIDINHSLNEPLLQFALEEIRALGCTVKILGSYKSYAVESP